MERSGWVELIWHIALNAGVSRISKSDRYLLSGAVVEGPRRDGRPGILRSQLTLTPEGHVHIRWALQRVDDELACISHCHCYLLSGATVRLEQETWQAALPAHADS